MKNLKNIITLFFLFAIFSNSYAQNDSIKKPIECGTQRIADQMEVDKKNKEMLQDFIIHFEADEKSKNILRGKWTDIGVLKSTQEIIKEGTKQYDSIWDDAILTNSPDLQYTLLQHFEKKYVAVYKKNMFRLFDAQYYKNYQHPEVLGKWIMSEAFSPKGNNLIVLTPMIDEKGYLHFIEINEDYTFLIYDRSDSYNYEKTRGRYSFDAEGKISFNCNDIQYLGKKKEGKPFVSGPFKFTIENGVLILKK